MDAAAAFVCCYCPKFVERSRSVDSKFSERDGKTPLVSFSAHSLTHFVVFKSLHNYLDMAKTSFGGLLLHNIISERMCTTKTKFTINLLCCWVSISKPRGTTSSFAYVILCWNHQKLKLAVWVCEQCVVTYVYDIQLLRLLLGDPLNIVQHVIYMTTRLTAQPIPL